MRVSAWLSAASGFAVVTAFVPATQQCRVSPRHGASQPFRRPPRQNVLRCAAIQPGDPAAFPPSNSKVNTLPILSQSVVAVSVLAGVAAGAPGFLKLFELINFDVRQEAPIFGPIFIAAGIAHFVIHQDFCRMYPGKGAWGIWNLPGSASFHVNWTGVAEIAGGATLLLGQWGLLPHSLQSAAAYGLWALTFAVTPANLYMFTHGAPVPLTKDFDPPVWGHMVRGIMQPILMAALWQLAQ